MRALLEISLSDHKTPKVSDIHRLKLDEINKMIRRKGEQLIVVEEPEDEERIKLQPNKVCNDVRPRNIETFKSTRLLFPKSLTDQTQKRKTNKQLNQS